jgi:hypothetical protein
MAESEIERTDVQRWLELLRHDGTTESLWRPEEFADILRHQLGAPLAFDEPRLASELRAWLEASGDPVPTFGSLLLLDPQPPLPLLRLVKNFAKAARTQPGAAVPPEVATLLYFAAIAAALLRCRERITESDGVTLHRGFAWALAQPWADEATRALLQEAARQVSP